MSKAVFCAMLAETEKLVIDLVIELSQDWDLDDITIAPATMLGADVGFESLDIVQLVVLIEKKLGSPGIPFEQLFMKDGQYIDDVSVADISEFIVSTLSSKGV